jgi:hypothetical protein
MTDHELTVQILKDVLDGIEHHYGKAGVDLIAEFALLKARTRDSNKLIDELEATFGPLEPSIPLQAQQDATK